MSETPWYSRAIFVDPNCFPHVQAELDLFVATYCPPLAPEDCVGLMVFGLSKRLIVGLPPRNTPLPAEFRANCEGAALEIVAYSHPELLRHAGIVDVEAPPPRLAAILVPWWKGWCSRMPTPMSEVPTLDARQVCIFRIASSIMKETLSTNILLGIERGVRMHRREHGQPGRDPDDDVRSWAAEFWAMPPSEEKETNCYVVGKDGRIHINTRYVRDQLGRPSRLKVVGKSLVPPPSDRFDENHIGSHGTHFPKERSLDAIEGAELEDALDTLGALDALRVQDHALSATMDAEIGATLQSVVQELLTDTTHPVERLLLRRATDVIEGRTTPTDLAREAGLPERTTRHAWGRIITRMAANPRLRAWDRSA